MYIEDYSIDYFGDLNPYADSPNDLCLLIQERLDANRDKIIAILELYEPYCAMFRFPFMHVLNDPMRKPVYITPTPIKDKKVRFKFS